MGEKFRQLRLLTWNSTFIQFVHPEEGAQGDIIVILAGCEFHFIREHENLV